MADNIMDVLAFSSFSPPVVQDSHGANNGATLTLESDNIEADKQLLIDNNVCDANRESNI